MGNQSSTQYPQRLTAAGIFMKDEAGEEVHIQCVFSKLRTSRITIFWEFFLLMAVTVMMAACDIHAPSGAAANRDGEASRQTTSRPNKQEAPSVPTNEQDVSSVAPPSPDSVLYFIYKKDGDGATSYEVDYGSWVGYWYGYEFDLKGKRYFTGFGYKTPEKFGEEEEGEESGSDGPVAISQATFLLETKEGKTAWSILETDGFVGEFGANEKPLGVDRARRPQSYETPDGRLLLAVPTADFSNGVAVDGFALFVYDPEGRVKLRDKHWAYLGNIAAGEDNSAACDEGNVMPCVSSKGTLSFQPSGDGMPSLRVEMEGTAIASPGKTRELGAADAVTYAYDRERNSYQP